MPKLKVRIAVAVDPDTLEWACSGWGGGLLEPSNSDKMGYAVEAVDSDSGREQMFWIDAELEVAPEQVVNGVVSAG